MVIAATSFRYLTDIFNTLEAYWECKKRLNQCQKTHLI